MLSLRKITFVCFKERSLFLLRFAALLSLLLAAAAARAATYYSAGQPTVATPSSCGVPATCGGVQVATDAQLANLTLAANMYAATTNAVALRLPLTGTAPAGYRAGMLVSNLGTEASVQTLGTATLRTYLQGRLQETQVVNSSVLQAALLSKTGDPAQLELVTKQPFDAVELELGSTLSLGGGVRVQYAYGVPANANHQVAGYLSRFGNGSDHYSTGGCGNGINNPQRTVDNDLTNYATFASLATVNCPEQLQVGLEGVAPAGYQAGFVVGGTQNILNADLLGGLTLRTYRNGMPQEAASGVSLLALDALPEGQQLVYFKSTKEFDAVSVERTGQVTALDNLQLYYGSGTAATPAQQTRSTWPSAAGHSQSSTSGTCLACSVQNQDNTVDDNLGNYATIQVGAGVANAVTLRMDLNGPGVAGNRAGVVLGRNSLIDASVLDRTVIRTYDASGNVLESRSGSSLLTLATLADGRQSVSFNTTRDFSAVSITMNGVASAVDTTNVYYAFADDTNGSSIVVAPTAPLPVQLLAVQVQRVGAGEASISWATASELNSARFVVERSANPQAGFVAVGQVAAAGSSATTRRYTLRDAGAAALRGTLYYRLREEDQSGTATYSATVTLAAAAGAAPAYSVYPNPATRSQAPTLSLEAPLPAGTTVGLYSGQGQVLATASPAEGQTSVPLATQALPAGLYYVVLRDASGHAMATQRLQVLGE